MIRIYPSGFKDIFAVCVETGVFRALFLPENGGRLASLVDIESGIEWMAQDKDPHFIGQTADGNYSSGEVGGFDDMFPTIDPMSSPDFRHGVPYPCHGEVCRYRADYTISEKAYVTKYVSEKLGFRFEKRVGNGGNGSLEIAYRVINESDEDFPCLWAAHFMLAVEAGSFAVVPFSDGEKVKIMFDKTGKFGVKGEVRDFERAMLAPDVADERKSAYKYFFLSRMKGDGCGYHNGRIGKTLCLGYDTEKIPYLGVWVNDGGYKDSHCFALEPCNLPFDSPERAAEAGLRFAIPARGELSFSLTLSAGK